MYLQFKDDLTGSQNWPFSGPKCQMAILRASDGLRAGLEEQCPTRPGSSGVRKDDWLVWLESHNSRPRTDFWWFFDEDIWATSPCHIFHLGPEVWSVLKNLPWVGPVGLYHFVALSCEEKAKSSSVLWAKQQQWLTSHCLTDSAGTQNHPMASRWLCCRMSQLYIYILMI